MRVRPADLTASLRCIPAIGVGRCDAIRKEDAAHLAHFWNESTIDGVTCSALRRSRLLRYVAAGSVALRVARNVTGNPLDLLPTRALAIRRLRVPYRVCARNRTSAIGTGGWVWRRRR